MVCGRRVEGAGSGAGAVSHSKYTCTRAQRDVWQGAVICSSGAGVVAHPANVTSTGGSSAWLMTEEGALPQQGNSAQVKE